MRIHERLTPDPDAAIGLNFGVALRTPLRETSFDRQITAIQLPHLRDAL
jgi:hypothetical protein